MQLQWSRDGARPCVLQNRFTTARLLMLLLLEAHVMPSLISYHCVLVVACSRLRMESRIELKAVLEQNGHFWISGQSNRLHKPSFWLGQWVASAILANQNAIMFQRPCSSSSSGHCMAVGHACVVASLSLVIVKDCGLHAPYYSLSS